MYGAHRLIAKAMDELQFAASRLSPLRACEFVTCPTLLCHIFPLRAAAAADCTAKSCLAQEQQLNINDPRLILTVDQYYSHQTALLAETDLDSSPPASTNEQATSQLKTPPFECRHGLSNPLLAAFF